MLSWNCYESNLDWNNLIGLALGPEDIPG
jgi:hypothetical protein